MATQRIAIIGSGAAGLGAAWGFHTSGIDFTLYEAGDRLGGQARTVDFPTRRGYVPIDMGVIITNPWSYPNLYAAFDGLGVQTLPFALEFGASFGLDETWAIGKPAVGSLWNRVAPEAFQFELEMFHILNLPLERPERLMPLKNYVAGKYSSDFIYKVLLPLLSVLAVAPRGLLEQPLVHVAELMQYLSFVAPSTWRILRGGTRAYIAPMAARFMDRIRLNTRVAGVTRSARGVTITTEQLRREPYDAVVIATAANQALKLLVNPTPLETELLSAFTYVPSMVYLHSDERILSPRLPREINTQYAYSGREAQADLEGTLTFNSGQVLGMDTPALVTFSAMDTNFRPPKRTVAKQYWEHLLMTPAGRQARDKLGQIQDTKGTWFAGAYTTFPGHETAFVSGLVIAYRLGAAYPYADKPLAEKNFNQLYSVMFPEDEGEPHSEASPRSHLRPIAAR